MNPPTRRHPPHLHRSLGRRVVAVALMAAGMGVGFGAEPDAKRFAFDKDRQYLKPVRDFSPLEVGWTETDERRENPAFEALVLHAHEFSTDELNAAARRDIPLGNLLARDNELREGVRYELVWFKGLLKRLQRIDSPPRLKAAGVNELYEAWVFPPVGPALTPICFMVSECPAGLQPATDYTPGVPVSGCGYFMKIVEYPSYEPNPNDPTRTLRHRAPLLVGRAVLANSEPAIPSAGIDNLLTVSLLVGGVLILAMLLFAVWLRRSDAGSRKASALRRRNPYSDGTKPPIWEQPQTPEPTPTEPPTVTDTPNQS